MTDNVRFCEVICEVFVRRILLIYNNIYLTSHNIYILCIYIKGNNYFLKKIWGNFLYSLET